MNQASIENIATLLPISTFLLLLILQMLAPRRDLAHSGMERMCHNIFLFLINVIIMRVLIPVTLVMAAVWAQRNGYGLFNLFILPTWLSCLLTVILLDFAVYWQHVATHKLPILWRLHKVHHSDNNMDVTTAIRFHPLELLLSLVYKAAIVIVLGGSAVAVIIWELLFFIGPAFNHSNLRVPSWLDSKLRWIIATPDVHRAHHSVHKAEQDTNYGFFLIWWDRLFGSYTAEPQDGHVDMEIGLSAADDNNCKRVDQMLMAPFK